MTKQPIIWKKEKGSIQGQCAHRWSVPFTTANGLTCECFTCHATRQVEVEKDVKE